MLESILLPYFAEISFVILIAIIIITIYTLSKGADLLVSEAVVLSLKFGISKTLIGATIISLGTTLPEAAVSVLSAIRGRPELALGNAVGSIICDTGLILGLVAILAPLSLDRKLVNKQGLIQLGCGIILILSCVPYTNIGDIFKSGGVLPRYIGFIFVILLFFYLGLSYVWARGGTPDNNFNNNNNHKGSGNTIVLIKLILGILLVVVSAEILIPAVVETAHRMHIPTSIIAATLVAFGTSVPELATAIVSVRRGHGEIALGNIIGADILNVLFVAGTAAAVTKDGLIAGPIFFITLFPSMLLILLIFRLGVIFSKEYFNRFFAILLLGLYLGITILNYII